jgi:exosome complex component RRP40
MAASPIIVLPGDEIAKSALPQGTGKKKTLTIGPGLRHIPPDTVTATIAGALITDNRKNAASVEYNSGRVISPSLCISPSL